MMIKKLHEMGVHSDHVYTAAVGSIGLSVVVWLMSRRPRVPVGPGPTVGGSSSGHDRRPCSVSAMRYISTSASDPREPLRSTRSLTW